MAGFEYADVVRVQAREKSGQGMAALPEGFYGNLNDLIERARVEYEKLASVDSSTLKAAQTYGMIQKLRACRWEITNVRCRKLLLMAHQAQAGGSPDLTPLDAMERLAYEAVALNLKQMHEAIGAAKPPEKPATDGGEAK